MNDAERFIYIKQKSNYKEVGVDFDFDIEVDDTLKEISFYFKASDSSIDWQVNFDFMPFKISLGNRNYLVHRGFGLAYLSARKIIFKIFNKLRADKENYKICIYGWSYGSAVSGLLLADLTELNIPVYRMITYGSVKMWYSKTPELEKAADEIKEYTTPNDLVTWVVPFCHRINKEKVGEKFCLSKIIKTAWYHTHYEEFIK